MCIIELQGGGNEDKRPDKKLEKAGFKLKRHRHDHDTYQRGENEKERVSRHKEIKEPLTKSIIKRCGLK